MEPRVQEALLQEPAIRKAVQQAGQEALADPAVQQHMLQICRQKFPEFVGAASQQIKEWANDPEVQQRACEYAGVARLYAGHAVGYAGEAAGQAGEQLVRLIEQGPTGVRILAFCGGIGSCVNSGLTIYNPLQVVYSPLAYLIAVYQILFSVTTVLFEAKPEWIEQVPGLNWYQDVIIDQAEFLTEVGGRGLFYGFQGSLWLVFSSVDQIQNFVIGAYFVFVSTLHIAMHFGIMPQHIAQKIREGGYVPVPLSLDDVSPQDFVGVKSGGAARPEASPLLSVLASNSSAPPAAESQTVAIAVAGSARQPQEETDRQASQAVPKSEPMLLGSEPIVKGLPSSELSADQPERVTTKGRVEVSDESEIMTFTPSTTPVKDGILRMTPAKKNKCCSMM